MDKNKTLAITDARRTLYHLVKTCQARALTYVLTFNGKAAARLLSENEYESLVETLEVLGDRAQVKRLAKALKHVEEGKLYSHEAVFGHSQTR